MTPHEVAMQRGMDRPRTVFFGNCPFEMEEAELREKFPNLESMRMTTRDGRFTGAAFGVFPTINEAQAACRGSDNLTIRGRYIRTKMAHEQRGACPLLPLLSVHAPASYARGLWWLVGIRTATLRSQHISYTAP